MSQKIFEDEFPVLEQPEKDREDSPMCPMVTVTAMRESKTGFALVPSTHEK
jgi:hypothetical protein